jgi:hypothetical protein
MRSSNVRPQIHRPLLPIGWSGELHAQGVAVGVGKHNGRLHPWWAVGAGNVAEEGHGYNCPLPCFKDQWFSRHDHRGVVDVRCAWWGMPEKKVSCVWCVRASAHKVRSHEACNPQATQGLSPASSTWTTLTYGDGSHAPGVPPLAVGHVEGEADRPCEVQARHVHKGAVGVKGHGAVGGLDD